MHWIIQGNLKRNEGIEEFVQLLKENNSQYSLVKSIPFTNIIVDINVDINEHNEESIQEFSINTNENVVTMGSYSLARAAIAKGWKPGAFINDNFGYSAWIKHWGTENLLNADAIIDEVRYIKIPTEWNYLFARPEEDNKFFAGQVFERSNFEYWLSQLEYSRFPDELNQTTRIIVSSQKEIEAEYRLFVVNGEIVTGSLYRVKGQVITSAIVDKDVLEYAQKMISRWQPAEAFVIDIAIKNKGLKIIEVNNFNSSGFYKSDLLKIIKSVEAMYK